MPAPERADLEAVWQQHRRFVAAVLLAHMPVEAELDDLLQEVAMRLVRHGDALREPDRARAWLRTVSINVATSDLRQAERRRRLLRPLTDADRNLLAVPADGESAEGRRILSEARALPSEYREPLLLQCVEGLSQRAIAAALGLPETTIETRLVRARRLLRERFEKHARNAP